MTTRKEKIKAMTRTLNVLKEQYYEPNNDVEDFLEWLPNDARNYSDKDLNSKYYDWKRELEDAEIQLEKDYKNGLYGEQY